MSGIEVVGLVVPLLLTALQNWESCVRPFQRLKKYDQEATSFHDEVEIQRVIFRNECSLLLHEFKDHDVVGEMLDFLGHKEWREDSTEAGLARILGESLYGVQTSIRLLNNMIAPLSKDMECSREIVSSARQVRYPVPIFARYAHLFLGHAKGIEE